MEHPFAKYVRTLGKGKTGSRSLSREEAHDAMRMILHDEAEAVQIGAFLMLLRVKEESAEELAGFVEACRDYIGHAAQMPGKIDFDWSSYAGKRRQPHWFLLAALLLAQNQYRVFMHGTRGHTEGRVYSEDMLAQLGLPIANSWHDTQIQLAERNFAFMPLQALCAPLQRLIELRGLFGLRSPVHTLCRLLNPLAAHTTLQSVFHPAYAVTHHSAAQLLGERHAVVYKGDAGEVEYRPHARLKVFLLRQGVPLHIEITRRAQAPADTPVTAEVLRQSWEDAEESSYAAQAIIGSAAIALFAHVGEPDIETCFEQAATMWRARGALAAG
ncbi:MAG: glycosyl transferase family protein [Pseudomonadales bacterium]